jgi:chemotaxis protein CheX
MSSPLSSAANADGSLCEHWRVLLAESAKNVFSTMVGAEISIPEQSDVAVTPEVTAIVGLAGDMSGVLTFRCNVKSATEIASRMLGVPIEEAMVNQSDAVGEICNMVAGNFKAKIGKEDKCMLSVPTVITGCDYQFHSLVSGTRIEVPMIFEGEVVWLTLEISK